VCSTCNLSLQVVFLYFDVGFKLLVNVGFLKERFSSRLARVPFSW